jgi:hypothetical protein
VTRRLAEPAAWRRPWSRPVVHAAGSFPWRKHTNHGTDEFRREALRLNTAFTEPSHAHRIYKMEGCMCQLAVADGQDARWNQTSVWSREHELKAGNERLATLVFPHSFGSLAIGRAGDEAWTFKRVGFLRRRATVRIEGSPYDLAVFEHDTWAGGGTLTLNDGRRFLVTSNSWQTQVEFRRGADALFRYRTEGLLRESARVELTPEGSRTAELSWLLLFGWYLVLMMHQDASTVVFG